jgi:hypothetical protein
MPEIIPYSDIFDSGWEPKLQQRFIMSIQNEQLDIPSFIVKAANRPTANQEPVEIDHINMKRKFKGKTTWEDISVTMYDPIVPSGAQAIMDWLRLCHEPLTGRDGYSLFYKMNIQFKMLGPVGDVIELWTLHGAFPSQVNFGEMDWSSTEMVNITATIAYDYAILEY